MQFLNWGAKATDKVIPPNGIPVVPGLTSDSHTTYKNSYPVNE